MATLANIGNLISCGTEVLGTGTKGCSDIFRKTVSLYITKAGTVYDNTADFTTSNAYIESLQIDKKLIILKGVEELTVNLEEDVRETDGDGVIRTLRKGKYSFNAKFRNGLTFQAALASLNSFGAYDISFVDADGNILGTATEDSFKGFTVGMLEDNGYMFENNSESQSESISFQFLDRDEVSVDNYMVSHTVLDWKPQKQEGVNQVSLEIVTPSDTDTTITVKAKLGKRAGVFAGADFSQFLFTVGGATANPTGGDDSVTAGTYILTGFTALATNDVVTAKLYNNSTNKSVVKVDTELFQSNTSTATTVA
jgi:hypothetical protein